MVAGRALLVVERFLVRKLARWDVRFAVALLAVLADEVLALAVGLEALPPIAPDLLHDVEVLEVAEQLEALLEPKM